jgi:hypothetical protein
MTRCRELGVLAFSLTLLAVSARAHADDSAEAPPRWLDDRLLRLGEHFFSTGQYYRSVGVFEELALLTRDRSMARHAHLRIALSYQRGLQTAHALAAYDKTLARYETDPALGGWLRYMRVLARLEGSWRLIDPLPIPDLLAELAPLENHQLAPYQILAGYQLVRLHLASGGAERARQLLARQQERCIRQPLEGCEAVGRLGPLLGWSTPSRRIPLVGALLSAALPGLGALYDGRPVDAIYYLALTAGSGLMAWDIYDGRRTIGGQKASFYVLSTVAATFYLSSVVQGWLGAKRANEVAAFDHTHRVLRQTELPLPKALDSYLLPVPD